MLIRSDLARTKENYWCHSCEYKQFVSLVILIIRPLNQHCGNSKDNETAAVMLKIATNLQ